jgi:hypothetical protein
MFQKLPVKLREARSIDMKSALTAWLVRCARLRNSRISGLQPPLLLRNPTTGSRHASGVTSSTNGWNRFLYRIPAGDATALTYANVMMTEMYSLAHLFCHAVQLEWGENARN